jgi:L-threonylcarbamoyladenylate synthase
MDRPTPHVLTVDPAAGTAADLAPAAAWVGRGGIVAFPTDTFYGLAVDPSSTTAVRALFDLKGRDASAAVPLIAASIEQVDAFCGPLAGATRHLATAFWPGPLSLVCAAPSAVAEDVHAGRRTIAIRVPAHAIARALAAAFGAPVTATSANPSGAPPARSVADLGPIARDPRVLILDAGDAPGGIASTIVDARSVPPVLIRAGAIAWDRVLGSL